MQAHIQNDSVTIDDIVEHIELNKLRAELKFKIEYLLKNGKKTEELEWLRERLEDADKKLSIINRKLKKTGFCMIVPHESKIAEITKKLNDYGQDEIFSALEKKEGEVYLLLAERGALLKENFANRKEIAKLNILINSITKGKDDLLKVLVDGKIRKPIHFDAPRETKELIQKLLCRVGIPAYLNKNTIEAAHDIPSDEIMVFLDGRRIWLENSVAKQFRENEEKLMELSSKIQLKNAKRQIETFSENEEMEFAAMQAEYLKLLKERDELLKRFCEGKEPVYYKALAT